MALISKISRLNRIPQLLNKKRDAERDAKQQRERASDQQSFSLNDRPAIKRPERCFASKQAEAVRMQTAKSLRQGIGRHVDLFV